LARYYLDRQFVVPHGEKKVFFENVLRMFFENVLFGFALGLGVGIGLRFRAKG
jgi:hypothetical protein